jgi:hypothetical protein
MPAQITMNRGQIQTASGLNVIACIWLFISAFAIAHYGAMLTNNVIFGIIVTVLALVRASGAYDQAWLSWLNALFGIWVVISPWAVMGTGPNGPTQAIIVNNCITGGVIIALGCWSAVASDSVPMQRTDTLPPRSSFTR